VLPLPSAKRRNERKLQKRRKPQEHSQAQLSPRTHNTSAFWVVSLTTMSSMDKQRFQASLSRNSFPTEAARWVKSCRTTRPSTLTPCQATLAPPTQSEGSIYLHICFKILNTSFLFYKQNLFFVFCITQREGASGNRPVRERAACGRGAATGAQLCPELHQAGHQAYRHVRAHRGVQPHARQGERVAGA
jgi:hypothetical protein